MPKIGNATALERILVELAEKPIQPDEFTISQIIEKDNRLSSDAVFCQLRRLEQNGSVTKRKLRVNGSSTNVYRYV